jgi:RimJ/RimL family protein N-acetyltransferase
LEPWDEGDLPLLRRLLADPAMMEHLGGPETEEQLIERQARYERLESDKGQVFKVVDEESGEPAGWVGYWERVSHGQDVWEVGWAVLPEFQGRGIAGASTALAIESARADGTRRFMHAYPSVDNLPSNAICRKLGFELVEAREFEYPKGNFMLCNDWRLDLGARS